MRRLLQFWRWLVPARQRGDEGERLAEAWLRRERGYRVVVRNWRNPRDRREEIDLVCRDQETLVFVEVKARAEGALVPGYYAVDARKKRVLLRAARSYLRQLRERPRTYRFDIVEITLPAAGRGGAPEILHFENVPLFPKQF
jgi:putative endonuclease